MPSAAAIRSTAYIIGQHRRIFAAGGEMLLTSTWVRRTGISALVMVAMLHADILNVGGLAQKLVVLESAAQRKQVEKNATI